MLRPAPAGAFVGESSVIDPVTGKLTAEAEKLIKAGKALPEIIAEARGFAGGANVGEASAAMGTFEAAGLLPTVGAAVASFSAGWEIGSEACEFLGFSGCIHISGLLGTSAPAVDTNPTGGKWVYSKTAKLGGNPFAYYWEFNPAGGVFEKLIGIYTVSGKECVYWTSPAGQDRKLKGSLTGIGGSCSSLPPDYQYGFERNQLHDLQVTGPAADSPSVPNFSFTPEKNWAEKEGLPKRLKEGAAGERVGQAIAHHLSPATVKNPYGFYVEIPNCDGLLYPACTALLEERGLEPSREDLNWSQVTTPTPNEVQELNPARSAEVEKGSTVKVITNPPAEDMPVVIPQPEPNETYSHYAARLNPALTPERHDLEAPFVDPGAGPNAVIDVSPEPETKVDPHGATTVRVSTNPADSPAPSAAWAPPSIPAVDMSPLSGVPAPCSVFPFGLLCWAGEAVGQFNVTPTCPELNVPLSSPLTSSASHFRVSPCNSTAEGIMAVARPVFLLLFAVACGFLFARATRAVGGD